MRLKGGSNVLKVIVISGPTASGKTDFSLRLAQKIDGEIISADSLQVYKGLDIGTAKVTIPEQLDLVHYGLDLVYPDNNYNVADFQIMARKAITEIIAKGKTPIIVGGTGLYIQSTLFDYEFLPNEQVLELKRYDNFSTDTLINKLRNLDAPALAKIEENNRRRIIHAIALAEQTNLTKTQREQKQEQKLLYDILPFAIVPERVALYERINLRVDRMLKQGLIAEIEYFANHFDLCTSVKTAIGYREPLAYLQGDYDNHQSMVADLKQNTRRFAKRQITWIRNQKIAYDLVDTTDFEQVLTAVDKFI